MSFTNTTFESTLTVKGLTYFLARDGYAYSAGIYKGSKKLVTVSNSGNGGETSVDFTSNVTKKAFDVIISKGNAKQILADSYNSDTRLSHKWTSEQFDAESITSHLVEDAIFIKETQKQMSKFQTKAICFGVPGEGKFMQVNWKKSISQICKSPIGKANVQREIDRVKRGIKGTKKVIFNTNLTRLGLTV